MSTLSVIIICKNAEKTIKKCLQSVHFADEIIILDSGSNDNTLAICQRFTPHITQTDWPGFGRQKQRALAFATGDWVLSLDADEIVSPALGQHIQSILQAPKPSYIGYDIPIRLCFFNQHIRFANGAHRHLRLFQRQHTIMPARPVHEAFLVEGSIGRLRAPIIHYSYDSIEQFYAKINQYSSLRAQSEGKKTSLLQAIGHGYWMFLRIYLLNLGFLDGRAGFVLAQGFALQSYLRYLKSAYTNPKIKNKSTH